MALSPRQILDLALSVGFQGNDAITATAIAIAESQGDPQALNPWMWTRGQVMTPPHGNGKVCGQSYCGDYSLGLWQINMRPDYRAERLRLFGIVSMEALYDPATNARAAFKLYRGRGGAFTDWATYPTVYQRYLPSATAAWAQRVAEQPNPAVTPPNPPAGPLPIPAAAGSTSAPVSTVATAPAPAGSTSPVSVHLPSWVRLLLWALSFYRGTNEKPTS